MKILHLEDSEGDATLIRKALGQELAPCDITRVETREAFLKALPCDWDIILSDYQLPAFDGLSALRMAVEKRPDLQFIFVTGVLSDERAVETLKSGATDYIAKHRLDRLPQAVARAMREKQLAKENKDAELQLKASLCEKDLLIREKDVLLQEVHHRVKNNLQIVCSLLSMQSDAAEDSFLASALRESQRRIHSMALIHEMLYASSSLSDIDFGEYTQSLTVAVSNAFGLDPARIRLVLDLEPIRFDIDRAIPCGLILNELLSNAFKYAFPKGHSGEIRVSLRRLDRRIRLAVEDTGVGLPAGPSVTETKSLGLKIVNVLVRQLGANLEVTSNRGSHFVLTFAGKFVTP